MGDRPDQNKFAACLFKLRCQAPSQKDWRNEIDIQGFANEVCGFGAGRAIIADPGIDNQLVDRGDLASLQRGLDGVDGGLRVAQIRLHISRIARQFRRASLPFPATAQDQIMG